MFSRPAIKPVRDKKGGRDKSYRYLGNSPLERRRYVFHDHIHQPSGRSKELFSDDLQQRPDIHLEHGRFQQDTQTSQSFLQGLGVFAQHLGVQLIQWGENEVNKSPRGFGVLGLSCEFTGGRREVDVSPEAISKRVHVEGTASFSVHSSEGAEGKAPVHISTGKSYITVFGTQSQCGVRIDRAIEDGQ